MSVEVYSVIQVKGGKFHRPEEITHERMEWIRPMATACGSVVTPLNVFLSEDSALDYTGGREEVKKVSEEQ